MNRRIIVVTLTVTLLLVSFVPVALAGAIPKTVAATTASSSCASPTVPTGTPPTLNSTFTLKVIGATGKTVIYNQSSILSLAACTSYGGFAHGTPKFSDDYGNYTGIPVLTLVNLVGGITAGETVVATSGTDNYQTAYNYTEVVNGTGWGQEYTATSSPSNVTTPVPMYLVVAYLWNDSAIGAYSCTSGAPPCPNGPTTSGTGPLRTVTVSSTSGYLIAAGAPWNKAVATIQVNSTDLTTNSTSSSSITTSSSTSVTTTSSSSSSAILPTTTTSVSVTTTSSSSKSTISLTAGYLLVVATSLIVIVGAGLAYLVIRRRVS